MKNLILIALVLFSQVLSAQENTKKPTSDVGISIFMPVGVLTKNYELGYCANVQIGIHETPKYIFHLNSGCNYIFGKKEISSLIQFPLLLGGYYKVTENFLIGTSAGLIYGRERLNEFNFNYTPSIRYEYIDLNIEIKYSSVIKPGKKNDLNGICIRLSYDL